MANTSKHGAKPTVTIGKAPAAVVAKPVAAVAKPAVAPKPKAVAPVVTPQPAAAVVSPTVTAPTAPAAVLAAPVATPAPAPIAPPTIETVKPEEPKMNETMTNMSNGTTDAIKSSATAAYSNGKAALEQVTAKSKETIEHGMKSLDEMSAMAKGNVEALIASTKAATAGLETIAHQVAEFSRKSFEDTTAAARALTTVKTPNELMQLQSDFAKAQFDAAVAEMSKLSETLVKLAGEVFEPVQNRIALATDKLKTAVGTSFKN